MAHNIQFEHVCIIITGLGAGILILVLVAVVKMIPFEALDSRHITVTYSPATTTWSPTWQKRARQYEIPQRYRNIEMASLKNGYRMSGNTIQHVVTLKSLPIDIFSKWLYYHVTANARDKVWASCGFMIRAHYLCDTSVPNGSKSYNRAGSDYCRLSFSLDKGDYNTCRVFDSTYGHVRNKWKTRKTTSWSEKKY